MVEFAGIDWILREWSSGEPVPATPAVTLRFENGKFAGRSGCNRYSGTVTVAPELGALKIGPTIATRMACPGPAMEIESRFIKQLEAVTKFKVSSGQMSLIYQMDDVAHAMTFQKK